MNRSPRLALLAVFALSLACSVFVGGPALPTPLPPAPQDPMQSLAQEIERAVGESITSGRLVLHLTEQELTAYIASKLATQDPPLVTEPRVVLDDQRMVLYGRAGTGMIQANIVVATDFTLDSAGTPKIRITDAQLGPLPMPQALQDAIAAALDEALTGSLGPAAIGFRLESIDIAAGTMTITGRVR